MSGELEVAVSLLEEALFLCMNGERAPGGNETWGEWCRKTEFFLRRRHDSPGDNPDSPPPDEPGLPGGDPEPVAIEFAGDDPGDDPANITPLSPEDFTRGLSMWPVIPEGFEAVAVSPLYVSPDGGEHWYEVPDGTSSSEFLAEILGNQEAT